MEIVLATCRPKPELTSSDERLALELERRGASVVVAPWEDIAPTAVASRIVCLRSTWDYHQRWDEFQSWVSSLPPGVLWNPPETVLWNADKLYLRDLADAQVPLPPTRWFERGERPDCADLLRYWDTPRGVLKPRVSATAFETYLMSPERQLDDEEWKHLDAVGCLFQAFVPEIETQGEVSLVFIAGKYSHAVRKLPARGDYRVQHDFGGSVEPIQASVELQEFGASVLDAVSLPWLYARVDVVEMRHDRVLMELELIEPDLFLTEPAAAKLAEALIARVIALSV